MKTTCHHCGNAHPEHGFAKIRLSFITPDHMITVEYDVCAEKNACEDAALADLQRWRRKDRKNFIDRKSPVHSS